MKDDSPLAALIPHFALLSLLSVGGINAVLPDLHRFVVDVHGWTTDKEFADLFALAQAAPGPNFLIFALIGWHVDGLLGAAAGVLSICGPCSVLAYVSSKLWQRFHDATWRRALQGGLAPVAVGLTLASGWILSRAADSGWVTVAITAVVAALTLVTKIHPLWLFGVAGLLGILGLT